MRFSLPFSLACDVKIAMEKCLNKGLDIDWDKYAYPK